MQALVQIGTTPTLGVCLGGDQVDLPFLVDEIVIREGEDGFSVTLERWDENSEESGRPTVVIVQDRNVLPLRKSEAGEEVVQHPERRVLFCPANPRIRS